MKTIEILVGIPCSGKSTYSNKQITKDIFTYSISRDNLRLEYFGKDYIQNKQNEIIISMFFNTKLGSYLNDDFCYRIILDNTHCKEGYIDSIINYYKDKYNIKIIFFDISLIKVHYRNIIRYFKNNKWIPIKVINQMYKNYNKINKSKYKQYV